MKLIPLLMTFTAFAFPGKHLEAQTPAGRKMLVVYFSHSGNTRTVAEQIAEATGADLFEVVPERPYPDEYRAVTDQAKREIEAGARPALRSMPEDIGRYDVVFVGSPCWWATIAPPLATLLSRSDLKGKTVAPFMTHEGSRMGRSVQDIRNLCPGATVVEGLPVRGGSAAKAGPEVREWLRRIGILR